MIPANTGVAGTAMDILLGAKWVFFAAGAWLLWRLAFAPSRPPSGAPERRRMWLVSGALTLAFAAVLAYQASWQLTGFTRPAFVDFMRKYNRRSINPARLLHRGRIFDRAGLELAGNAEKSGKAFRRYALGSAAAHILGYADPLYGLYGLEKADNASLSGWNMSTDEGWRRFRQNLLSREVIRGNDLHTTLDTRLQRTAHRLMAGRRGAVVVLRPSDGAVLALVSAPSFDPENLRPALFSGAAADSPVLNRALQGLYPPGSTFKIVLACAAAERGFDRTFDCPAEGYTPAPGVKPIRDHEYYERQRAGGSWKGHGRMSIEQALVKSSNVFFARLGVWLGPEAVNAAIERFYMDSTITLYTGSSGSLKASPGSWTALAPKAAGGAAQTAIGQGALVTTPLHMAVATAAIANGGVALRPRLDASARPEVLSRMTTADAARRVSAMMRGVVESGTGRRARIPEIAIAGKTGTAQTPSGPDHSWFTCFAPHKKPRIVVTVIVENGGYGSKSALPVAVELVKEAKALGFCEEEGP